MMKTLAETRKDQFMKHAARICFGALFVCLSACSTPSFLASLTAHSTQPEPAVQIAQATPPAKHVRHARHADPKPEPTQQELVEYLRGKLLSFSPSDGINDNSEVVFDPFTTALTITRPDGRCVNYLNALDTNSIVWESFDPSDTHDSRETLLRLTLTSTSGKTARACYDRKNHPDTSAPSNRVRLLFSASQARQSPDFQKNVAKAVKKLIVLSGGAAEKKLF
jgi:hypothetical protein